MAISVADIASIKLQLRFRDPAELTISSGSITRTQTLHIVDTEADAPTDFLDVAAGGSVGDLLILFAAHVSRDIIIRHATGMVGQQFFLRGSQEKVLNNLRPSIFIKAVWANLTTEYWQEIGEGLLHNWNATAAPTVDQDVTANYSIGSTWIDTTNNRAYLCVDNTDGAAVWVETTNTTTETLSIVTKTGAYTVTDSDAVIICDAASGAFTITLPTVVGRTGKVFYIKKVDATANAVTIDGDATETIDGALTQVLAVQYNALKIVSDGSNWHIL